MNNLRTWQSKRACPTNEPQRFFDRLLVFSFLEK